MLKNEEFHFPDRKTGPVTFGWTDGVQQERKRSSSRDEEGGKKVRAIFKLLVAILSCQSVSNLLRMVPSRRLSKSLQA